MATKVLAIDDDPAIAEMLQQTLSDEGYEVATASDASQVDRALVDFTPDLIILDVIMPGVDGLVLCSRIRSKMDIPIIVLSASRRKSDLILALRLGADDFVNKPFDVDELLVRMEAVLRRAGRARQRRPEEDVLRLGDMTIDKSRRQVRIGADRVGLTATEFNLLAFLASDPERVFSRQELGRSIWGKDDVGEGRMVDVHIRRLRQKLEDVQGDIPQIVTVRGFGYKLGQLAS